MNTNASFDRVIDLSNLIEKEGLGDMKVMHLMLENHKIEFLNKNGKFVKLFSNFFNNMQDIIYTLNFVKKENWSKSKCYQYLIFPEAVKSLHCACENTINGYYDEATILMRSIFELFLSLVFLSKYPDNIEGLLLTGIKEVPKGTPKFNATNLLTDVLKIKKQDGKNFSFFSLLSLFTHGKKPTLLNAYLERTNHQKITPISIELSYNETSSNFCINNLIDLQHLFFRSIMTLFSTEIDTSPQFASKLSNLKKLDKELEELVKNNEEAKEIIEKACCIFLNKA